MTSAVNNYVNKIERQCWNALERYSLNHPKTARALAVVAAVGTLVKWIFAFPACGVECLVLAGKCIQNYTKADADQKNKYLKEFFMYLGTGLGCVIFGIPAGLFEGIYHAGKVFLSTVQHPLKTAKLRAADIDIATLLRPLPKDSEIAHILWGLFVRQKEHVEKLANDHEIAQYHFVGSSEFDHTEHLHYKLRGFANMRQFLYQEMQNILRGEGDLTEKLQDAATCETMWKQFKNRAVGDQTIHENAAAQPAAL